MPSNRLNILLVEDNPGDARLIRAMLAEAQSVASSYLVEHVDRLAAAREKCLAENFDAVLLDLHLPDSQGVGTLKKFHELFPCIPIIVLTGLNDSIASHMSMQHGALNYVVKDECTPSLLARAIQYAIERKRVEDHFKHLATHDALTGLPNRVLFYDRFSQSMLHAERNRVAKIPKWKLAVMLIDLDHFKNINDSLGHAEGDTVIQMAGQRLKSVLRESDTIARLGGDEFVALIEGVVDPEDCGVVGNKMLQSLGEPVMLHGNPVSLHASIGVSIYPDHAREIETLIRFADTAMYVAKQQRNQLCFYEGS